MIISLNWLKKYVDVDMPVQELATLIGARLVEIEEVIDFGAKYKGALVVKVAEASRLDGSDHLSIVRIDDGGVTPEIERNNDGTIQVVCGAPNIKTGQMVVWLPPESIVPETYNQLEPFKLGIRKLCGVTSNGMIASSKELDLSDDHEGILELNLDIKPGTLFADAYELDDYLLDIENKSLTHRPDCFGIIGFAREVAAIQGKTFKTPDWLSQVGTSTYENSNEVDIDVSIDNSELSERYQAVVMSGADSKKSSPFQIQTFLARVGVRPINAVVDVTNYLMMLTGQPLHAFDYDKVLAVGGGKADIHVRTGHEGEKLELLDGKTIELSIDDIVIASGKTAIGLAGAMGGANTAIDANTQKIIIESATFNLYKLRSTQMRHGIFSEAITRFTKGQPAELSAPVLSAAIHLMEKWSGAKCISEIVESYPNKHDQMSLEATYSSINNILGTEFTDKNITETLNNAEFKIEQLGNDKIKIKIPYWRADIHIIEDVAEEIGRLNGFDNIRFTLPKREFTAVCPSDFDNFRNKIRNILSRAGANEILSYNFVHGDVIKKAGQDVSNSYRITNSISPDLQYYRQTLTPSLLSFVHPNIKQGYDKFALFEINKVHQKQIGLTNENVPVELNMASLVVASKTNLQGAPYYQAKRFFDYLCQILGVQVSYEKISALPDDPMFSPFEYRRSAKIVNTLTGLQIGVIGEYKKSLIRDMKLPEYSAGFEINTEAFFEAVNNLVSGYKPLRRFPTSERDICFRVKSDITYGQIVDLINSELTNISLTAEVMPIDIYQPEDKTIKNITIRIILSASDHTLTNDEVNVCIDKLINIVTSKTQAIVI